MDWTALIGPGVTVLLALVGLIAWLVRVESKQSAQESRIKSLEDYKSDRQKERDEFVELRAEVKYMREALEKFISKFGGGS